MNFKAESITHKGGRNYNEDCCGSLVLNGKGCWVVADGLGGHRGGKEASRITVETVLREFERQPEVSARNLEHCILAAQAEILKAQSTDQELSEMRSTVAVLMADAEVYLFGHVGDTRLYLFREGSYVLRSKDHSVPQALVNNGTISEKQIRSHEDRNRLLKSLGKEDHVKPTVSNPEPVYKGDVFLLCTDGFWEYVLEPDMEISLAKSNTPLEFLKEMERRLRSKVCEGNDNYTGLAMFHGSQRLAPVAAKQTPVNNTVVPAAPRLFRMIWLIPTAALAIIATLLALTSSGQKTAKPDQVVIQPVGSQPAGESPEKHEDLTPQGGALPKVPPTQSPEKTSPTQTPSTEAKPATDEGKKKDQATVKEPGKGKSPSEALKPKTPKSGLGKTSKEKLPEPGKTTTVPPNRSAGKTATAEALNQKTQEQITPKDKKKAQKDQPPATAPAMDLPPATAPAMDLPPATASSKDQPPATAPAKDQTPATAPAKDQTPATAPAMDLPPATAPAEDLPPATAPAMDLPPATATKDAPSDPAKDKGTAQPPPWE